MIACSARTYAGNCSGRTAVSSMPVTGFARPLRPVSSDKAGLAQRPNQDHRARLCLRAIFLRYPISGALKLQALRAHPSKNSTAKDRFAGKPGSSSIKSRAAWNCGWPLVWSRKSRSICSMAAGYRSRNSTVACIASATDSKKNSPSPFPPATGQYSAPPKNRRQRSFTAGKGG